MTEIDGQKSSDRVMIMTGNNVGLALMRAEDVPTIARWNQDLEFTALLGTPGEAHTFEMREEAYKQNSRIKPDSAEFVSWAPADWLVSVVFSTSPAHWSPLCSSASERPLCGERATARKPVA